MPLLSSMYLLSSCVESALRWRWNCFNCSSSLACTLAAHSWSSAVVCARDPPPNQMRACLSKVAMSLFLKSKGSRALLARGLRACHVHAHISLPGAAWNKTATQGTEHQTTPDVDSVLVVWPTYLH